MDNVVILEASKNFDSTYLYGKGDYTKALTTAIMTGERIDKKSEAFTGIIEDVKRRQTTSVLVDVLNSSNVILLMCAKPLPSSFAVFTGKDIKEDKKTKVFVDCTSVLELKNGFYVAKKIDSFVAYLVSAMANLIYYADPNRITTNTALVTAGAKCFSEIFTYILDFLRISGYRENKDKVAYLAALYFQCCHLWKDLNESSRNIAMKVAKVDKRTADLAEIFIPGAEEDMKNIDIFIKQISTMFKNNEITTEILVDKWLYLIGSGSQFGLELFPAFSNIITNAYSGAYLMNDKTIMKICDRDVITYTTALFSVGQSAFNKRPVK